MSIGQHIAWDPSAFVGHDEKSLEMIRRGFMFALDRVRDEEKRLEASAAAASFVLPTAPGSYIARFVPQAWVNDYAIEVDCEGPCEFDVTPEIETLLATGGSVPQSATDDADELRGAAAAPAWVRDWTGPFEVMIRQVGKEQG